MVNTTAKIQNQFRKGNNLLPNKLELQGKNTADFFRRIILAQFNNGGQHLPEYPLINRELVLFVNLVV